MNPRHDDKAPPARKPSAARRYGVPAMLFASSMIMALAWLGHLRFKHLPFTTAIFFAWLIVLPEYLLNIAALRWGYGIYSGGRMAAFNLCTGVICVAVVSRWVLDEAFTPRKLVGFGLMVVALVLIAVKPVRPSP